jgi:sensor histidine kinase YesM
MSPYLQAAWGSFTWRRVLFTQVLAQIVAVFVGLDEFGYFGEYIGHTSMHFVFMSAYAFLLLPVAFCAEEAVTRGARPIVVYSILLVFISPILAAAVAAAMQWMYCVLFAVPWPTPRWGFTEAGSHFSVPCSLALLVYMNGRAADRMLEGVRGAELKRVQLDQQLVESRLATAEAQIDPQMLFGALAQIKRGFEESQPHAEKTLNELIQTLRAAFARTAAAGSEAHNP